ncbi:MAG: FAD-dependent oxidoreductase, partial [Rhodospirillales bacterium]|nr:FAD-dependent oxidoreductase [Rhodospirillales bacterium]
AAAYATMAALGMLAVPAADAAPPALPAGGGRRVLILGAGIAGMVMGLALRRAGYDPLILEARSRPGGRNWSLRGGDTVAEFGSLQRVEWETAPYLYVNPGPARLPYHHSAILGYCRELGVALEVMCNENRGALLQDDRAFAGKAQSNRRIVSDLRGHVAALAAKAVDAGALDQPIAAEDLEKLRAMLKAFGALDRDLVYRGSSRAGYARAPGAGMEAGTRYPPLDLRAILASDFWHFETQFGESFEMAATMMQPVGGMDRIGAAFAAALGRHIRYGVRATALRRTEAGVRVEWDGDAGAGATEAPFVVLTQPLSVLRRMDADFSPALRAAMAAVDYVPAGKIAWQASRRFWEEDAQIYGGISWTSRDITQIWYPTAGLHAPRGILLGAYIWSQRIGARFAAMPPGERLRRGLADLAALHPQAAAALGQGVAVAWKNIPFSEGAWSIWSKAARAAAYPRLLAGEGPFLFAGEHMSFLNGWQEGAARSAHYTLGQVAARMRA